MINNIWGLLILPLLTTAFLYLSKYRRNVVWQEYLLLWGVSCLAIFMSQMIVEHAGKTDTEFWGFNSVSAYYDEPYQYWTTCSESYACGTSCTGSGKNRSCSTRYCTRTYPCTKWAGDEAFITDQNGNVRATPKRRFESIAKKWGERKFVELYREKKDKIQTDGDRYTTHWPGTWESADPLTYEHTYENRVNNSSSIVFREVSEDAVEKMKLVNYPEISEDCKQTSVIDNSGKTWPQADAYFQYLNGVLGPKRFGKVFVMIFRGTDRSTALWQKDFWKNGNKNEFNICIGADKEGKILWGEVFSWTEKDELRIEARDYIEQKLGSLTEDNLIAFGKYCETLLTTGFVKPEFTEKFSHLSVEPSTTSKVVVFIVILLLCAGIATYVIKNNFNE